MIGFRLAAQRPPEARRVNDDVVMRLDHVYEVAPEKMSVFRQLDMPVWDSLRIGESRWEHLDWMHDHWADRVLSVAELDGSGETETMEHDA